MAEQQASFTRQVLVIEVDDDVAFLIEALLVREGFEVALKRDGREGLNTIRSELPADIVVCNLMLPHVDGFQLIAEIRATPGWKNIPIVVLSSMHMEKHIVKALEAGANDYITKPFRPAEFVARLRRYLPDTTESSHTDIIPRVGSPNPTLTSADFPRAEANYHPTHNSIVDTNTSSADPESEMDDVVPGEHMRASPYLALVRAQIGPLIMALVGLSIVVMALLTERDSATTEILAKVANVHHVKSVSPTTVTASPAASPTVEE